MSDVIQHYLSDFEELQEKSNSFSKERQSAITLFKENSQGLFSKWICF